MNDTQDINKKKFEYEIKRRKWRRYLKRLPLEGKNKLINQRFDRNIQKGKLLIHTAPGIFSVRSNPNETIGFLNLVESLIKDGNPIYLDFEKIKILSIESIMYFLSLVRNLRHKKISFSIRGNVPKSIPTYELLLKSGFFNYVENTIGKIEKSGETFEIIEGNILDRNATKRICDFIIKFYSIPKYKTSSIYEMIIELMTNTVQHAYQTSTHRINNWYLFANYRKEDDSVEITFLDNGLGIPTTVNKNKFEEFQLWLSQKGILTSGQVDLIEASLAGAFMTRTKEKNRGKGLPMIYSLSESNKILDLSIISNKGFYTKDTKSDVENKLHGTIIYWKINRGCCQ